MTFNKNVNCITFRIPSQWQSGLSVCVVFILKLSEWVLNSAPARSCWCWANKSSLGLAPQEFGRCEAICTDSLLVGLANLPCYACLCDTR
jgi:hypothetical protein